MKGIRNLMTATLALALALTVAGNAGNAWAMPANHAEELIAVENTADKQVISVATEQPMTVGTVTHFTDVPADYGLADIIKEAGDCKLVSGYGDGTFRPYEPCSGRAFANFLARAFWSRGFSRSEGPENAAAYNLLQGRAEALGYDSAELRALLVSADPITCRDAVRVMAAVTEPVPLCGVFTEFSDVDAELTAWINRVNRFPGERNVIAGYEDNTFQGENVLTRGRACAWMMRYMKNRVHLDNVSAGYYEVQSAGDPVELREGLASSRLNNLDFDTLLGAFMKSVGYNLVCTAPSDETRLVTLYGTTAQGWLVTVTVTKSRVATVTVCTEPDGDEESVGSFYTASALADAVQELADNGSADTD